MDIPVAIAEVPYIEIIIGYLNIELQLQHGHKTLDGIPIVCGELMDK